MVPYVSSLTTYKAIQYGFWDTYVPIDRKHQVKIVINSEEENRLRTRR